MDCFVMTPLPKIDPDLLLVQAIHEWRDRKDDPKFKGFRYEAGTLYVLEEGGIHVQRKS